MLSPDVLVGRDRELQRFQEVTRDVLEGCGRLLLLSGEPGIGKTRALRELLKQAEPAGFHLLSGRCLEGSSAPAFWPWIEAIRPCMRDNTGEMLRQDLGTSAADIGRVFSEVHERLPELTPAANLRSDTARFRFFDGLTCFLTRVAARQPLLLTLDDLQWADADSLHLLEFVARAISQSRILIACALQNPDPCQPHQGQAAPS
jgi:predicted ATPase